MIFNRLKNLQSFFHPKIPHMANITPVTCQCAFQIMTPASRAFQRQFRLVCHSLEVFFQLQEMEFETGRDLYNGMAQLVDQTVSCLFLGISLLSDLIFRPNSASTLASILPHSPSSVKFIPPLSSICAKTLRGLHLLLGSRLRGFTNAIATTSLLLLTQSKCMYVLSTEVGQTHISNILCHSFLSLTYFHKYIGF